MSIADFLLTPRQQNLFRKLFLNPGDEFTLAELIRAAGPGRGATQRLIDQMEAAGIILRSTRGNQSAIRINERHPFYAELRSIAMKSFGLAEVVEKALGAVEGIQKAFIFGSTASGLDRPESDIDLMVIGEMDVIALNAAVEAAEKTLGRSIHLNAYDEDEWLSLSEDSVIKSIIEGDRITVAGDDLENEPGEPQLARGNQPRNHHLRRDTGFSSRLTRASLPDRRATGCSNSASRSIQ